MDAGLAVAEAKLAWNEVVFILCVYRCMTMVRYSTGGSFAANRAAVLMSFLSRSYDAHSVPIMIVFNSLDSG